jgi:hypothetical protein
MTHTWDVEVVADSDTRWKWGAAVAPRLAGERSVRIHATLLLGRSAPSQQQLVDVGIEPASLRYATVAATVARLAATDAQVVVLACLGGGIQALLHAMSRAWAGRRRRPVVVTGYAGLVFERVVDGALGRAGADVVLANSANDATRLHEVYAAVGADPYVVVRAALPFLDGARHEPSAAGRDRPFTVTFVAQPTVPESKAERRYAIEQAAEHARRHPERQVLVKLRGRPGERTTHAEPWHYEMLLPDRERPRNLEFVYGAMAPVLDRTDLCVTVSSTAAVEAMHRHIPTAILTDFGVREMLGNHLFLGSGAFASWPALHDGAAPATDPEWAAANGVRDPAAFTAAAARVGELVEAAELPAVRPWLDGRTAGAYVPALLARYGLDSDGVPTRANDTDSLAGRALRTAARRAYGVGVHVVEPRIKRLAQL